MTLNTITKHTATLFVALMIGFTTMSQDKFEYVNTNNARESIQIAQTFINNGQFVKAKKQLKHTIKLKDNFAVAHRELGRVYMELGEYENAIDALELSFSYNADLSRAAYFECGESYFFLGNLSQALYYYNEYNAKKGGNYTNRKKEIGLEKQYDDAYLIRQSNIEFVSNPENQKLLMPVPKNLGDNVNSSHNEYLPAILSNGQRIVYTRDRKGKNENILTAVRDEKKEWTKGRALDEKVNTHSNEGMAKFSTDGKKFYFTGCERPDTDGGCDIYEAEMTVFGEVTSVKHVEGINTYNWDSQPCVTCNKDAIYFSSNRPGGFGGTDIYVSYRVSNDLWGHPINLGPEINTAMDEEAPYIATDGKTLYYTSNGLPGFGEGDIYMSRFVNDSWTQPKNMGNPLNSSSKELGFFIQGDGKTAFFASARPSGNGGLDLYEVELPEEFRPLAMNHIEGSVVDDETGKAIQTEFTIRRTGEKYDYYSDENGAFFTCLQQDKAYTFQIEVKGYKQFMSAVYLPKTNNEEPTLVEIRLIPEKTSKPKPVLVSKEEEPKKKPPVRNRKIVKRVFFYFDVNSSDLTAQTESKLDDLVNTIKFDNKWNIEVIGYADSSGDPEYNKILSEKRAGSVSDYLKNSGIVIDKVSQEGRGAIDSENEMEKKKSRRVEVIMRGVLDDNM